MTDYFLESSRLHFRFWAGADLPLARSLWGDRTVTQFIASHPLSECDIRDRLGREIASADAHGIQYWPIFLKHGGAFVGCCGLRPHHGRLDVAELGVHVVSAYWRRGYALEAGGAAIEYAFNTLHLKALFAGHSPLNLASRGLLQRLGFVYTHDEFYAPTGLEHPSYELTAASRGFAPDDAPR